MFNDYDIEELETIKDALLFYAVKVGSNQAQALYDDIDEHLESLKPDKYVRHIGSGGAHTVNFDKNNMAVYDGFWSVSIRYNPEYLESLQLPANEEDLHKVIFPWRKFDHYDVVKAAMDAAHAYGKDWSDNYVDGLLTGA